MRWFSVQVRAGQPLYMTDNQYERLRELQVYARKMRDENEAVKNKTIHDICTNVLAWIILIEKDQLRLLLNHFKRFNRDIQKGVPFCCTDDGTVSAISNGVSFYFIPLVEQLIPHFLKSAFFDFD